jgi:hypothetical protein
MLVGVGPARTLVGGGPAGSTIAVVLRVVVLGADRVTWESAMVGAAKSKSRAAYELSGSIRIRSLGLECARGRRAWLSSARNLQRTIISGSSAIICPTGLGHRDSALGFGSEISTRRRVPMAASRWPSPDEPVRIVRVGSPA